MVENTQQDEVEVKTPAGSIRARGTDLIAIISAIAVGLMVYMQWEHRIEAKAAQTEVVNAMQQVADSQSELSYLISLTPDERTKLNLDMPESLRKKIRR